MMMPIAALVDVTSVVSYITFNQGIHFTEAEVRQWVMLTEFTNLTMSLSPRNT